VAALQVKAAPAETTLAKDLRLARIVHCTSVTAGGRRDGKRIMDPKLATLLVLFGAIIGLSNLRPEHLSRLKNQFALRWWRKSEPVESEI
jgi:hypothetical protein